MANSRGWRLLSCQLPRGGDEKRGQVPHPPSTLQHFSLITQLNNAVLSIVTCDFLFQWTCSFVLALGFYRRLHAATTCTSLAGLSWIWLMHNEILCPRLYTLHSLSTPPLNWPLKLQVCAVHSSVFFFESFCIRWTLTTSAFVVHHVQTWKAWDRICQMMVQVIFCQDQRLKVLYFFHFRWWCS